MASQDKQNQGSNFDADKDTPIDTRARRTGQGDVDESGVRPGAEAEAPGTKNEDRPGDPNQGTEAR